MTRRWAQVGDLPSVMFRSGSRSRTDSGNRLSALGVIGQKLIQKIFSGLIH